MSYRNCGVGFGGDNAIGSAGRIMSLRIAIIGLVVLFCASFVCAEDGSSSISWKDDWLTISGKAVGPAGHSGALPGGVLPGGVDESEVGSDGDWTQGAVAEGE